MSLLIAILVILVPIIRLVSSVGDYKFKDIGRNGKDMREVIYLISLVCIIFFLISN